MSREGAIVSIYAMTATGGYCYIDRDGKQRLTKQLMARRAATEVVERLRVCEVFAVSDLHKGAAVLLPEQEEALSDRDQLDLAAFVLRGVVETSQKSQRVAFPILAAELLHSARGWIAGLRGCDCESLTDEDVMRELLSAAGRLNDVARTVPG